VIIYLGQKLLPGSRELLFTKVQDMSPNFWFVLAPDKDLAVSPEHSIY